jgi:hypothetical protein
VEALPPTEAPNQTSSPPGDQARFHQLGQPPDQTLRPPERSTTATATLPLSSYSKNATSSAFGDTRMQ